jgi:hypothetical protein
MKSLFKAFENMDPPTKQQKAITPKLLRKLLESSQHSALLDTAPAVAADIVTGGFFFATRSCEYSKTPVPGKTKCLDLDGILFRTASKVEVCHSDPLLLEISEFVTVTFVNQKSGIKMDSRSQRRTGDPDLCPVLRYGTQVQRILRTVPKPTGSTTINTLVIDGKVGRITNGYILDLLRNTCRSFGGKATFGYDPHEIGNKSIRSGAAMALFLNDNNPTKIMIMGRWASEAFLAYIRPQVLEWTDNMSKSMINVELLTYPSTNPPPTTRTRPTHHNYPFNGPPVIMPSFHLDH